MDGVITINKRFRFISAGAFSYTVTATDIGNLFVAPISATQVRPLISTWRLKSFTSYSVLNRSSNAGMREGIALQWAVGSTALEKEAKEQVPLVVETGLDGVTKARLVPPARSTVGFWHDYNTTGDLFSITQGNYEDAVYDIDLEFTLGVIAPGVTVTVTSANALYMTSLRIMTGGLTPMGYSGYAP